MLIKPWKQEVKEPIRAKNGFVLLRDSDGEPYYKKDRFLLDEYNACRYEALMIYPNKKKLIKECSFGSMQKRCFGNIMDPVNFMYSAIDTETGEITQFGAKNEFPESKSSLWAGWFGLSPPPMYLMEDRQVLKSLLPTVNGVIPLSDNFELDMFTYEDELQMEYAQSVGLLNSFFSQWGYVYPFEASIVIDSDKGFSLKKFTYLKGMLDEKAACNIGKVFVSECDKLTDLFMRNCKREGVSLLVFAFVGEFGSIIKIKPKFKSSYLTIPINHSDSFIQTFKNAICPNYYMSEEQRILINNPILSDINDELFRESENRIIAC